MSSTRSFVLVLLGAAAVTAALAGASLISANRSSTPGTTAHSPRGLFSGVPQHGLALGRPSAPVTLIEYADLQCPYCAAWARQTLPALASEYVRTGRVRLVWHGLAFIGPDSGTALTAVVAAGRQNHLWDLADGLYRVQGAENTGWVTSELIDQAVAAVPGLDRAQLERDRHGDWAGAQIRAASSAAEAAGIEGTPSFEIGPTGGTMTRVSLSSIGPEGLRPAIEALLAG